MILAVTGTIGAGKSTTLMGLAAALKGMGLSLGGLISARLCRNGERSGYELLNLTERTTVPLARLEKPEPGEEPLFLPLCHLFFYRSALVEGNEAILKGLGANCLIIDEIGHWELSGGGWAEHLKLVAERKGPTILGMRIGIAADLKRLYGIDPCRTLRLDADSNGSAHQDLIDFVSSAL